MNSYNQKVFQLTDNLNFFKGDHTYTVGFSFEKFEFDNSFLTLVCHNFMISLLITSLVKKIYCSQNEFKDIQRKVKKFIQNQRKLKTIEQMLRNLKKITENSRKFKRIQEI